MVARSERCVHSTKQPVIRAAGVRTEASASRISVSIV